MLRDTFSSGRGFYMGTLLWALLECIPNNTAPYYPAKVSPVIQLKQSSLRLAAAGPVEPKGVLVQRAPALGLEESHTPNFWLEGVVGEPINEAV